MADITTVRELVNYYISLLIIQYQNKQRAKATIELFVSEILASGIIFDVRDAYNINTAVGAQLDIIGKYVGIDRFFNVSNPVDYFALTDYIEIDPDSDEKYGFTTYADFDEYQFNGTMNYSSIFTVANKLNDDDYRTLIKLKIIQNYSNHSHKSIDESIHSFFGSMIVPYSDGNMNMYYFVTENQTSLIKAAIIKEVLPRPLGVGIGYIIIIPNDEDFFGYTSYSDIENGIYSELVTGFTSYGDYDTKEGTFLSYRNFQ